jgi:hypothetical protein
MSCKHQLYLHGGLSSIWLQIILAIKGEHLEAIHYVY